MQLLPRTKSCFVCGVANRLGFGLGLTTDGQTVTARFCFRPEHVGFAQTVHGGLIATLLDEVMVWVCGVRTGCFAFTAELSVRFLLPVEPGEELLAVGELVSNRRNKLFEAKAELRDHSQRLRASATGKYLPVPASSLPEMIGDLVGDIGAIIKRPSPEPNR
jgi:uncharacterized protein (TIGR00369 family)